MNDISALFSPGAGFFLIAGPCVLEDKSTNLRVAERVARVGERLAVPVIFKASFDKANRSSLDAPRGPGLEDGLRLLQEVKDETGLPVTTDIHEPAQAQVAAELVDLLQIPAFLCRQTDLIVAAAATGRPVNLKKGQWMAPQDMANQVEKARRSGARSVSVTERGSAFGYHNLVVDMRSFAVLKETCGCPAVFDATHSVQLPGGAGSHSGGEPRHIAALAMAATAAGADALFVEVHPEPARAPSDAASMLRLSELEGLVERVLAVRAAAWPGSRSTDG
ncbi:MAG: 3-deoxy-8-phosphooctulonate synthase [Gemmatimonadetes bacterium]|uniref:2-dehydro-3-deoxyphosphooctonate aldolase n=1 Tax=Candidatus Kutchimonas denitrificans TaxID=3056748 RepID=A0AAE5CD78_9BACT|nr:3-deoxy-8-phosphooctulonate synthase [Gemmatimonadota bacterium]NIR75239.1 3-deoxy-8-phosphooctulonate synthase [Candidatus Kutchimonas denitrificans]NIS00177.1 3-deoxy-8-phosphooctulonate synthase [Gemmatimonadota bacterium]NIT65769.1 3-deoxy-8-phosphooctulonate synthase [Gemmatimonadota bacterium]NIU53047.1 3-deoxy-8-phosphooctulonate synthase [Gemmatimonadota bacterium]